ncbi:hypothetical protein CDL15_Pgr007452 [Punica granatum]|nr:hypothetical protein CDL15_Pgr007452 [Punica granatum]
MSFKIMGYETIPVEALSEANNGILGEVVKSCVVPAGFAPCDSIFGGLADGNYSYSEPGFLRDALVEWPVAQQVRTFYLVKWRLCDDPKVREKIEKADQEIYRRNRDQFRITEALREKRSEKACVLSQLKTLDDEDKQLGRVLEKKEPIDARESGLCSSEEELDDLISSLHYRISNCSKAEERRLTCEIKRLEMTRGRVRSNAAMRAWILEMSPECATQGEVIGEALEEVRKKQEAVREKIEHHKIELQMVEGEIKALEDELADVIVKRDKAYTRIQEFRKQRDDRNAYYYRHRAVLKDARVLVAINNVTTLEELLHTEVENFFSLWNSERSFRENYQRRIQSSLDLRHLAHDGRRRGSGYRPSVAKESLANLGTDESRAVEDEDGVVITNNLSSPEIISESGDGLADGKKSSFKSATSPEIISENGDDLASLKNSSFGVVTSPEITSDSGYDFASGKSSSFGSVPSSEPVPSFGSMTSPETISVPSFGSVTSPETISENGYDLASRKNSRYESAPSFGSVQSAEIIISEDGDDLAGGKNSSFGTVPSIVPGDCEGVDDAEQKLKEMRREEEITKAKKAMERKKKLAEKNAAKAAIIAHKEAEKKLKETTFLNHFSICSEFALKTSLDIDEKSVSLPYLQEQEKKARKKAAAVTTSSEQTQEEKAVENAGAFARVKQGIYNRRDKFWRRHCPKGTDPVLKAILKRRRSANYWFWAVSIALFLAVFTVFGYCVLQQL